MTKPQHLILLVDDDPDFIEINRHILEPAGYRVICAEDPQEAWVLMQEHSPDLVVSDLMMSNLDSGFSFAQQIKNDERFRNTPVIIVTGVGSQAGFDFTPRTEEDLRAMHADAFLTKPVRAADLLQKVATLLPCA